MTYKFKDVAYPADFVKVLPVCATYLEKWFDYEAWLGTDGIIYLV